MADERVLVVDDEPINLELLRVVMASRGYLVDTATDADSAHAAIAAHLPDIILMDVQLPGQDGLALATALKAAPRTAHIPIVAVTANAMAGDERRALHAGCDDYVTKPIDIRQVPQIVAAWLQRERD